MPALLMTGCGGGRGGSAAAGDSGPNIPFEDVSAKVRFDAQGHCYINGAPFVPVGIYDWFAPVDRAKMEERLAYLKSKGFNTVLNYGNLWDGFADTEAYLDAAERHGMKVILHIKDLYPWSSKTRSEIDGIQGEENIVRELARRLKDKPALLAWYINDEWPPKYAADIRARYQLLRTLDPDHPTYGVIHNPNEVNAFKNTCRVLGMDSYPVPTRSLDEVADFTRRAKALTIPCWMVIQAFDWRHYSGDWGRQPTLDEMAAMNLLAINNGATGILLYAAYDLDKSGEAAWADAVKVVKLLCDLDPIFLRGAPSSQGQVWGANGAVRVKLWEADGRLWALCVNSGPTKAAVRLTGLGPISSGEELLTGQAVQVQNSEAELSLPAKSGRVFRF